MRGIKLFPGLFFSLFLLIAPVLAQEDASDAAFFRVADVSVDVTADNAAAARDKGLIEAERSAFDQLLARLGVAGPSPKPIRPPETALAAMVQAFDVQSENPRADRYIGTLSIQFKPAAVRAYLRSAGLKFSEARSRPLVLLPLVMQQGRPVLWEERTPWRTAWENAAPASPLVPLIVPAGEMDDLSLISSADAAAGQAAGLAALASKYQAGVVVVIQLEGQSISLRRFDASGSAASALQVMSLPPAAHPRDQQAALEEGVREVLHVLETNWRQTAQTAAPAATLRVVAFVPSLADWGVLREKMAQVPLIARADVVSMMRGRVEAEIHFRGDIPALQAALAAADVSLEQSLDGWVVSQNSATRE